MSGLRSCESLFPASREKLLTPLPALRHGVGFLSSEAGVFCMRAHENRPETTPPISDRLYLGAIRRRLTRRYAQRRGAPIAPKRSQLNTLS